MLRASAFTTHKSRVSSVAPESHITEIPVFRGRVKSACRSRHRRPQPRGSGAEIPLLHVAATCRTVPRFHIIRCTRISSPQEPNDIIKRHKKEQSDAQAAGNRRRQQVKNRNSAYGYGRPRFRTWMQRNLQDFGGFLQRRPCVPPFERVRHVRTIGLPGAGPVCLRAASHTCIPVCNHGSRGRSDFPAGKDGRSPLAGDGAPVTAALSPLSQGHKSDDAFAKSGSSGQQPEARRRPPLGPKGFGAAAAGTHAAGRSRPFVLNRGPGFQQKRMQQRYSKANFQRGQMNAVGEGKRPRMRRWQVKPSPGAVLTVSVANPQASQSSAWPPPRAAKPQPKGVLLRFNFRAMANQTSLTLDERFSGLRNKRRFTAARNAGRTVTMP
nr:PREDICTED: UAP56-interacting factor-like [Apteryx mantelli mantelli]